MINSGDYTVTVATKYLHLFDEAKLRDNVEVHEWLEENDELDTPTKDRMER